MTPIRAVAGHKPCPYLPIRHFRSPFVSSPSAAMTGSIVSLEPLSSPSPSPPPPDEQPSASASNHSGKAGLDSDSELSELTEEEQEDTGDNDAREVRNTSRPREGKRKRGGIIPAPMWDWAVKNSKKADSRWRPVEEEEEEEQPGPARAMEEEEDEDSPQDDPTDPGPGTQEPPLTDDNEGEDERDDEREETVRGSRGASSENRDDDGDGEGDDVGDEDDDAEPDAVASGAASLAASRKGGTSPELTDAEEEEVDEDVPEDDDADVDDDTGTRARARTTLPMPADGAPPDTTTVMDVDEAPPPSLVAPIALAAAGSSIMAGSTVVDPPSPSPSSSSSSGSPSSSRSISPEPVPSDREQEGEAEGKATRRRSRKGKSRSRTSKKAKARTTVDADDEADVVHAAVPEVDDNAADEEADADSPELELDSDLQPAHRAEALDVLATIELRFALLRERLYVEKMENLAWEEALVAEGTHPELLHLHAELLKRRDKRLELASRRRDYEIASVTKRRKLDEDAVWSWWKSERDDLQTEMISESSRKRRKLERERRQLERPVPERRIPGVPQEIQAPPTLRDIVKSYPFGAQASNPHAPRQKGRASPNGLEYPTLTTLSSNDVARDLELLFQHRRVTFDPRQGMLNPALAGSLPPGYDFPVNVSILDGPGVGKLSAFPQHVSSYRRMRIYFQIQGPPTHGFPNQGPRLPHHHSAPVVPHFHPSQLVMEQELASLHRPGSSSQGEHMPQFPILGPMPGPGNLMRRSISPVPVQALHNVSGPGMPMGLGNSPLPPGFAGSKPNGWVGPGPGGPGSLPKELRRPNSVAEGREKVKDAERYLDSHKARERAEREREYEREQQERAYHVQMLQQRHSSHQHTHPHMHASTVQPSHHHLGPHHHHILHHHVLHHHHREQPNSAGPGQLLNTLPVSAAGTSTNVSPTTGRDLENRRPRSGAPQDLVDVPARQSGASPRMSAMWKGNDERSPHPDLHRERGRPVGPPPVGPHERLMTPFAMASTQAMQSNYARLPVSPRDVPIAPTAPPSVAPSRRASWSGLDDINIPRPASSASLGHPPPNYLQGGPPGAPRLPPRRPGSPPSQSVLSSWRSPPHRINAEFSRPPSPPHSNGVIPRPISPSSSAGLRVPLRSPERVTQQSLSIPQHLPPPPSVASASSSPARPRSAPKPGSPTHKVFARGPSSPGPTKPLPLKPAGEPPVSASTAGPGASIVNASNSSPAPMFPPAPHPSQPLPSRIPNGGIPEPHLGNSSAAPKVVPVDGLGS
ncbi:hypothetical protein WOLCODRAFT_157568 [Wolfiporia cocos MD-104 SS10]|uniref:Sds3-like-domain-containing protein n=1 Tax=Wolfiporia cocos (strain MD-104) TaxID=742152 RepID=A0A2H3JLJ7_WOLCO|nr:hypothetical protein WOLCODRAFT_157568 [Wolfiporia cocos MD-104 SS10]